MHFLHHLAVWWPRAQSTRDNHVFACNFVKYSPILNSFSLTQQETFLNAVINNPTTP